MTNPKIFIRELREGQTVESVFLCTHKSLFTDKNGKPYLALTLYDRSGNIEARIWEKAPLLTKNFERNDYIVVKGNVVSFQGRLQYNIFSVTRLEANQINADDFIPHTTQNIPEMYQKLLLLCQQEIQNPFLRQLILSTLEDPEYGPKFQRAPAAKSNHHAWIGGLLEHVLKLCELARDMLPHYPSIDRSLVYAGLILHDFGKIEELSTDKSFEYTDKGKLIGHLITSVEILLKKTAQIPEFPAKVLQHLQHIILSHHGKLEFGSPKEPMTLEAVFVHELDHLDSRIQAFLDIVARDAEGNSTWTGNNLVFGRPLYKATAQDLGSPEPESRPRSSASENETPQSNPRRPLPENPRRAQNDNQYSQKNYQERRSPSMRSEERRPQQRDEGSQGQAAPFPRRNLENQPARSEKEAKPQRPENPKMLPKGPLTASLGEMLSLQLKKEEPPQN